MLIEKNSQIVLQLWTITGPQDADQEFSEGKSVKNCKHWVLKSTHSGALNGRNQKKKWFVTAREVSPLQLRVFQPATICALSCLPLWWQLGTPPTSITMNQATHRTKTKFIELDLTVLAEPVCDRKCDIQKE